MHALFTVIIIINTVVLQTPNNWAVSTDTPAEHDLV